MNFLRLANRWDTLKFTNQFSFIWLSNVAKCYWTTVHILRFLVGELLAKLFSAEKRKTRFSKSPLCTLSHCSFVLSIFHDTAHQCYLNVFALFASDSFCISVWTFFDRQQMSPCRFSEAVCDEDFAQGGDRESGRGKNSVLVSVSSWSRWSTQWRRRGCWRAARTLSSSVWGQHQPASTYYHHHN